MRGWLALFLTGTLALGACGEDTDATRENDFVPLTAVTVSLPPSFAEPVLAPNTSAPLTAVGDFSGAFTRDVTGECAFSLASSSPPEILTLIEGPPTRVKAADRREESSQEVIATCNGVDGALQITVSNANLIDIALAPDEVALAKSQSKSITAIGTFSDGSTQDITHDVIWSIEPIPPAEGEIATVDSTGRVTVSGEGNAKIVAGFPAGGQNMTGEAVLKALPLKTITLDPTEITLAPRNTAQTQQFTATGEYGDGVDIIRISPLTGLSWTSSDTDVATVDNSGLTTIPADAGGDTTITATAGEISGTADLSVVEVTDISISGAGTLVRNETTALKARALLSNGTFRDVTAQANWESSRPSVAQVDNETDKGRVTAFAPGTATISASFEGRKGSVSISVQ